MATSESPSIRERPRSYGVAALAAIAGVALVAVGWLIPSQFKSLPVAIVAEAGRGLPGLREQIRDELDAGRPGVAATLAQAAVVVKLPAAEVLVAEVAEFSARHPDLAVWGEANAYLTNAIPADVASRLDPAAGVIRHFLPEANRRGLNTYLGNSSKAVVQALLATRELTTFRQFLPVFSSGGAPLDATILLAAMLVQSEEFGSAAARELRSLAEEAVRTGEAEKLELVYLDFLALGRRYNWGQLTALVRAARSLDTLAQIRHLHQVAPENAAVIAAAAMISQHPDAVADYVVEFGPRGTEALAFAVHHGAGSIDLLLRQQLPPDGELTLPFATDSNLARVVDPFVRFALHQPILAVVAKIAAYLLGGLLLFIAAERSTALRQLELARGPTFAARMVGATVICLLLVLINEPYLALGSEPSGFELKIVIPVLGATTTDTMPNNSFPIDGPTILSILFFFLLQALVYTICLLKLREIGSKNLPPLVRLRLAENEENLFDSGLYVGIAGTCISLVLQVLNVIEGNLLAAYSSNLFGILGVAFIKIRHVRPFKQRLILEAEQGHRTSSATEVPSASEIARVG